jgi:hypothetical protein
MAAVGVVVGIAMVAKTMIVFWLIGRSLDAADRKEGHDRAALRRRASWLGVQEAVWFFGICTLFSVI